MVSFYVNATFTWIHHIGPNQFILFVCCSSALEAVLHIAYIFSQLKHFFFSSVLFLVLVVVVSSSTDDCRSIVSVTVRLEIFSRRPTVWWSIAPFTLTANRFMSGIRNRCCMSPAVQSFFASKEMVWCTLDCDDLNIVLRSYFLEEQRRLWLVADRQCDRGICHDSRLSLSLCWK